MPRCWILLLASAAYVWFLLYVYPCAYTCASLQTPAEGLKMPFHPQRQQSPNTSVTDPSFYCRCIYFLLIFLFISSSSPGPGDSILHLSRLFILFFFLSFHVRSSPRLFVHVIFSHLCPPFPQFHSVLLSACVILITIHSYPPFSFYFPLFYSQYQNYLCLSLHLLSHGGEDKGGWDDLCLIQTLHWAPLIFSLVKCHRCVIVIKSYITGCWNVTLGGHDRSTLPHAAIFHSLAPTFGREM